MYQRKARPSRVRLQTQSGSQPHSHPWGFCSRASTLRAMTSILGFVDHGATSVEDLEQARGIEEVELGLRIAEQRPRN